jgi:hypothetical protein
MLVTSNVNRPIHIIYVLLLTCRYDLSVPEHLLQLVNPPSEVGSGTTNSSTLSDICSGMNSMNMGGINTGGNDFGSNGNVGNGNFNNGNFNENFGSDGASLGNIDPNALRSVLGFRHSLLKSNEMRRIEIDLLDGRAVVSKDAVPELKRQMREQRREQQLQQEMLQRQQQELAMTSQEPPQPQVPQYDNNLGGGNGGNNNYGNGNYGNQLIPPIIVPPHFLTRSLVNKLPVYAAHCQAYVLELFDRVLLSRKRFERPSERRRNSNRNSNTNSTGDRPSSSGSDTNANADGSPGRSNTITDPNFGGFGSPGGVSPGAFENGSSPGSGSRSPGSHGARGVFENIDESVFGGVGPSGGGGFTNTGLGGGFTGGLTGPGGGFGNSNLALPASSATKMKGSTSPGASRFNNPNWSTSDSLYSAIGENDFQVLNAVGNCILQFRAVPRASGGGGAGGASGSSSISGSSANSYHLDATWPFSVIEAFSIAVSCFSRKIRA